jgi:hypothetical protein
MKKNGRPKNRIWIPILWPFHLKKKIVSNKDLAKG